MEVTNLLRPKLQKYSSRLPEQVLKSKLSTQDFNRNLPKADKYSNLSAGVLCSLSRNLQEILGLI